MLSKLNFKSNMFSGILDGGKDEVLLEDSKMEKLMQAVGVIVSEDENNSLQNADDLSDSVYETTNTNSTVSDFVTSTMTDDDDVQDADMIRGGWISDDFLSDESWWILFTSVFVVFFTRNSLMRRLLF